MVTTNQKSSGAKAARVTRLVLMYALFVLIALVLMFPFYYMVVRSIMPIDQLKLRPREFFPTGFSFEFYRDAFGEGNYFLYTFNTLKIVAFNIIAVPLSASFVAYGFAKCRFKGKNVLFAIMLGTVMLPGVVTQIPLYVMYSDIGWLDTYLPFMIPNLLGGGAMNVFLIRQFMRTIPQEMEEAAIMDGAGCLRRFFIITLPLCMPILIFIMVGVFTANWGDYYGPMVYLNGAPEEKFTLAFKMYRALANEFAGVRGEGLKMAAGTFMSIFPLVLFFVFQRQLVDGVVMTGVKG